MDTSMSHYSCHNQDNLIHSNIGPMSLVSCILQDLIALTFQYRFSATTMKHWLSSASEIHTSSPIMLHYLHTPSCTLDSPSSNCTSHNICKCKSQIKLILSFHSFCSLRLRNQYYRIRMDIADNCTTFEQNCIRHQSLVISCFSEETKTTTQPVVRILNSLPQYWCLMLITKQAYANLLTKLMQVHNLTSCKGI